MNVIQSNYTQSILLIIILIILVSGICSIISLILGIYYNLYYNVQSPEIISYPTEPYLPPDSSLTNILNDCPPIDAENNKKCKDNMDWLQQNWDPSWAIGPMKENTRCYAYELAKQGKICP